MNASTSSSAAQETGAVVRLRNVSKVYDGDGVHVAALANVDIAIRPRRFTMVVGASGSGKTTLLNLIGCIDLPTEGRIEVCGRDVAALSDEALSDFRSASIAFVFQNFNLFPVLSAYENVEYPLLLAGVRAAERKERTFAMLEAVGLADKGKHRPNQLSGGQRQRVAIARSLVKNPALVLADEPTANLDSRTGAEVIALMRKVQEQYAVSFIFSTHDPQLISHAQETFVVSDGQVRELRPESAP